jgi:hypothetical protein
MTQQARKGRDQHDDQCALLQGLLHCAIAKDSCRILRRAEAAATIAITFVATGPVQGQSVAAGAFESAVIEQLKNLARQRGDAKLPRLLRALNTPLQSFSPPEVRTPSECDRGTSDVPAREWRSAHSTRRSQREPRCLSVQELRFRFEAPRLARTTSTKARCSTAVGPALPRISRLRARSLLQQYNDLDGLELARLTHFSRSRIAQILNLLCLAPDIQEQLLWLQPLANGHEVISEKSLRRLAAEYDWARQREGFTPLLARRSDILRQQSFDRTL